jgi:hypothetical protein
VLFAPFGFVTVRAVAAAVLPPLRLSTQPTLLVELAAWLASLLVVVVVDVPLVPG